MSFLQKNSDYFLLHIRATPNSVKNKINGVFIDEKNQEYLKVSIAAIADDGKANDELVKFLGKILKISKSKIAITRGETSRFKLVKIIASNLELKHMPN